MKKRVYMAPGIKARKIECQTLLDTSKETHPVTVHPGEEGGDVLAKPNDNNAWSTEEDEQSK